MCADTLIAQVVTDKGKLLLYGACGLYERMRPLDSFFVNHNNINIKGVAKSGSARLFP